MAGAIVNSRPLRALRRGLLLLALTALSAAAVRAEPPPAEQARVDALIAAVAQQAELRFVRGGVAYTPAQAARFLQEKMRAHDDKIRTAEDFIEHTASRSSMTGVAYRVRWPDGREVDSAVFLRAELARLDAARRARP